MSNATGDRLKAMRRIVAVQAQVKRIAEWKLASIEERKVRLETATRELAGFLDGENAVGRFATLALKQARRLAEREAAAERDRIRQAAATLKAQSRHKLAEEMTETFAREDRAVRERQALEQLIESFVSKSLGSE
jgi:hypothetical protein